MKLLLVSIAPPLMTAVASLHRYATTTTTTTTSTCYCYNQNHQHHCSHPWIALRVPRRQRSILGGNSCIGRGSFIRISMMPSESVEDEPSTSSSSVWQASPLASVEDIALAKSLSIWPLDEFNVELLNEVHPRNYVNPSSSSSSSASITTTPKQQDVLSSSSSMQQHQYYDLVVIGAGAGGLVSSRQAARRGASSCMISAELAGGDCLNAGCVPSKALLRCAKMIREVRKVLIQNKNSSNSKNEENEFGISIRHRTQQQFQHSPSTTSTLPDDSDVDAELDIELSINFAQIMRRMRKLRSQIAPIDGHARGISIGSHVYQGRGVFTSPTTIEVIPHGKALGEETNPILHFRKAVIATGGRPYVPVAPSTNDDEAATATATTTTTTTTIPGLHSAPYTTNLNLFNLPTLPPRMIILGSGIVALEMAQAFATFGSHVTVLSRSSRLFASSSSSRGRRSSSAGAGGGESDEFDDAAQVLQHALEKEGVSFLWNVEVKEVKTLRYASEEGVVVADEGEEGGHNPHLLPLMRLSLTCKDDNTMYGGTSDDEEKTKYIELQCECLLLAMGRVANVQNMGLEDANVQYHPTDGILVNDYAQSISNPNVYAVGDCVAHVPRLTHMSGEMAKVVVQNSLFNGQWKLSSLVVPAVMYTDPEYAVVQANTISLDAHGHVVSPAMTNMNKVVSDDGEGDGESLLFDTYKAELKHNDRAILDGTDTDGFVTIRCQRGTGKIISCTIVSTRAGEMINEVSLAIKHGIDLEGIGRNIHSYPTLGEAVMSCGIQYINSKWETM